MDDGLKDRHRAAILAILAAVSQVERAVLFGSRAIGTFTNTSDVDIALFGSDLTVDILVKVIAEMSNLSIPQEVDILLYDKITNPKLLEHIDRYGKEIYRKDKST